MTETAILHGLVQCTNEEYHSSAGISKTQLDAINVSPLNFWDKYINPEREPQEYKHCFAVGDGTHKLVLEPGTFEQTYAVGFDKTAFPDALDTVDQLKQVLNERGIAARGSKPELIRALRDDDPEQQVKTILELKLAHDESIKGKIEMPAKNFKDMMAMLKAINNHHSACGLLSGAETEQSFYVTDDDGVLRKCRTDLITYNGQFAGDLKTTDDVSAVGFGYTIEQRGYHMQAAWYLDILKMLYGKDAPQEFFFIAAQKFRPYDVAVHYLTEAQIEVGRILYRRALETYKNCMARNIWPGADGGQILQAVLPQRAMRILTDY